MTLKGTRTEKNILTAFAGESQARNRYTFFANKARKEGFHQIADIFEETASQESEHAKRLFKLLEGGDVMIQAAFPAGVIADTATNLQAAAAGEYHEWSEMYPEFAQIAEEENLSAIATVFRAIAVAEKQHDRRYAALMENIRGGRVFKRDGVSWRCRNCGYVHEGQEAPGVCPACAHAQGYFEILGENW